MFRTLPKSGKATSFFDVVSPFFALCLTLVVLPTTALLLSACEPRGKGGDGGALKSGAAPGAEPARGGQQPLAALETVDVRAGTGAEATSGKKVHILYKGTLKDGTSFDARQERNRPFVFAVGDGTMIDGIDQGVRGMKVGGVRRVVIPPHLGYGTRAVGNLIPPNSTLIFEIELLKVD